MNKSEPKYLAVYGTLTEGCGNHMFFLAGVPHKEDWVHGWCMYTFGSEERWGFPAIFEGDPDEDKVRVELYPIDKIDPDKMRGIDRMELGAGYHTTIVSTASGEEAYIYAMSHDPGDYFDIWVEGGDWRNRPNG